VTEVAAYLDRPEFRPHDGPRGIFKSFVIEDCRAFPGTRHWCGVYAPHPDIAAGKATGLMVLQDGPKFAGADGAWRTPNVLDTLIGAGTIPPIAGVFVSPGFRADGTGKAEQRSLEYDTLSAAYSDFLIDEVLPRAALHASWSRDPDLHAIGGWSSGAICGFTVAWQRPDAFRKIYSANGSFTNIRGGGAYPRIVLDGPKRPLRVYLCSTTHDLSRPDWGDWPSANKAMAAALEQAGYDTRFDFGDGTHEPAYAASRFPEALNWLWR
jgi:enterochelin esterase family protein